MTARPFAALFRETAARCAERIAVRSDSQSLTWEELLGRVDDVAGGLAELGVARGDTVGLLMSNCPEFMICDLAALTLGATPFSIYPTLAPDQLAHVLDDAAPRVVICEASALDQVKEGIAAISTKPIVVAFDEVDDDTTFLLTDLELLGDGFDGTSSAARADLDDLLTIIYTSGTTGPPKGVELTNRNLLTVVEGFVEMAALPDDTCMISYLPAAHIAERAAHYYLPVAAGYTVRCCPEPAKLPQVLAEVRPQLFLGVPRIFEKLKGAVDAELAMLDPSAAAEPTTLDPATAAFIRQRLGFDRAEFVSVGGAPTPAPVLEFFHAIGVPLAELWGMSEVAGYGTANRPGDIRLGTVGRPCPGVEMRVADDGELFVRGAMVMAGYRNRPAETSAVLSDDGWLATGDIGEIDQDGYVRIVDRKKDLIINAAGKNMSPANIEAAIQQASGLIDQVCVVGNGRPYNVALITLDPDAVERWKASAGAATTQPDDEVAEEIDRAVAAGNETLSRVEQVKRYEVLPHQWTPDSEETTPTHKLRRSVIEDRHRDVIEALFSRPRALDKG